MLNHNPHEEDLQLEAKRALLRNRASEASHLATHSQTITAAGDGGTAQEGTPTAARTAERPPKPQGTGARKSVRGKAVDNGTSPGGPGAGRNGGSEG